MKTTVTLKLLLALVLALLCGILCKAGQCYQNYDWPFTLSTNDLAQGNSVTNEATGLYYTPTNGGLPAYAGAWTSCQTNITFTITNGIIPNPCFLFLQYQANGQDSPFTSGFYLDTNNFLIPPPPLDAPSGGNVRGHQGGH